METIKVFATGDDRRPSSIRAAWVKHARAGSPAQSADAAARRR